MLSNATRTAPSRALHYTRAFRHVTAIIIAVAMTCSPIFTLAPSYARPMTQTQSAGDLIIYDDNLTSGWQD